MTLYTPQTSAAETSSQIDVIDVRLGAQPQNITRFVIELDSRANYHLFLLNNPPRAVIDFPTLHWNRPKPPLMRGLVKGWRSGQFGNGTRIVLDLTQNTHIANAQTIARPHGQKGMRLAIDLAPAALPAPPYNRETETATNSADAIANIIAMADPASWGSRPAEPSDLTRSATAFAQPPALPPWRRGITARPLIVIDAGHGGVDPGALAINGRQEKDLTLAVAHALAARLSANGTYRVALTRSRDIFVKLTDRVTIARRKGADLFISLHADSANRDAQGATLYTLSNRASDQEAAEMAESENRADLLAGLEQAKNDDDLATILIDMNHTETSNRSHAFSAFLTAEFRKAQIQTTNIAERSAGFAVLKAPDIPAVLVEMGYLSNPTEAKMLFSPSHQTQMIDSLDRAISRFFKAYPPQRESPSLIPTVATR